MKEIGGYFELDRLVSNHYHKNVISLNSGRNALLYLLKARKIKKIFIPYYLCDSISKMCLKNDYAFEYYKIDLNFIPIFEQNLSNNEYIYIVNYFGQLTNECILRLREKYENIIIDNSQSFFQKPVNGVDTIYSCRKFFGVPDGAYLSTECKLDEKVEYAISYNRMQHILGRFECNASDYYSEYKKNEEYFDNDSLKRMSKLSNNILGAISYEEVLRTRNYNFTFLSEKLKLYNKLDLNNSLGAFAYPLYAKNGIEVRNKISKEKIYIPILWPNVLKDVEKNSTEYLYAANILPIPCDQRYSIDDMERILKFLIPLLDNQKSLYSI